MLYIISILAGVLGALVSWAAAAMIAASTGFVVLGLKTLMVVRLPAEVAISKGATLFLVASSPTRWTLVCSMYVPFFVARIYAELLRRQGKKREALEWLRGIYPGLPKRGSGAPEWMVEAASAEVVEARIKELERELGE